MNWKGLGNRLAGNPLFTAGLGLLGSRGNEGPQAVMQGLLGAADFRNQQQSANFQNKQRQWMQSDRARAQAEREAAKNAYAQAGLLAMEDENVPAYAAPLLQTPETADVGLSMIPQQKGGYSILGQQQATQMGLPEGQVYQVNQETGRIAPIGSQAPSVSVNMGGQQDPWQESDVKAWQKRRADLSGLGSVMPQVNSIMDTLMRTDVETGPMQEMLLPVKKFMVDAFGGEIPGLNEQQSLDSMISFVAPRMRVSGSGSSSDKDIDLFKRSIASLGNTPQANYISAYAVKKMYEQNLKALDVDRAGITAGKSLQERNEDIRSMDSGIFAKPESPADVEALPEGAVYYHPKSRSLRIKGWRAR